MRICSIAFLLAMLSGELLRAQGMPLVIRVPIDTSFLVRPRRGDIHIGESWSLQPSPALIVDSVMIWSGKEGSQADGLVLGTLNSDDIADVTVLKGPAAIARGACGGALIIITTKSGRWRPPAGSWTPPAKLDCSRVAP